MAGIGPGAQRNRLLRRCLGRAAQGNAGRQQHLGIATDGNATGGGLADTGLIADTDAVVTVDHGARADSDRLRTAGKRVRCIRRVGVEILRAGRTQGAHRSGQLTQGHGVVILGGIRHVGDLPVAAGLAHRNRAKQGGVRGVIDDRPPPAAIEPVVGARTRSATEPSPSAIPPAT